MSGCRLLNPAQINDVVYVAHLVDVFRPNLNPHLKNFRNFAHNSPG